MDSSFAVEWHRLAMRLYARQKLGLLRDDCRFEPYGSDGVGACLLEGA